MDNIQNNLYRNELGDFTISSPYIYSTYKGIRVVIWIKTRHLPHIVAMMPIHGGDKIPGTASAGSSKTFYLKGFSLPLDI